MADSEAVERTPGSHPMIRVDMEYKPAVEQLGSSLDDPPTSQKLTSFLSDLGLRAQNSDSLKTCPEPLASNEPQSVSEHPAPVSVNSDSKKQSLTISPVDVATAVKTEGGLLGKHGTDIGEIVIGRTRRRTTRNTSDKQVHKPVLTKRARIPSDDQVHKSVLDKRRRTTSDKLVHHPVLVECTQNTKDERLRKPVSAKSTRVATTRKSALSKRRQITNVTESKKISRGRKIRSAKSRPTLGLRKCRVDSRVRGKTARNPRRKPIINKPRARATVSTSASSNGENNSVKSKHASPGNHAIGRSSLKTDKMTNASEGIQVRRSGRHRKVQPASTVDVYEFDDDDFNDEKNSGPAKSNPTADNRVKKEGAEKKLMCQTCNAKFSSASSLKRHIENDNHQYHAKNYACSVCFEEFQFLHLLRKHQKNHDPNDFPCSICHEAFSSHKKLQDHLNNHHTEDVHTCDVCNCKFTQKDELDEHRKGHFEREFRCQICCNTYTNRSSLNYHKRTIHNDGYHVCSCDSCGKSFNTRQALATHVKGHSRYYTCKVCGREFKSKNYLEFHRIKNHSGQKPLYYCNKCPKTFFRHDAYFKHLNTHQRHVRCGTCGLRYRHEDQWINHEKLHLVHQEYECKICKRVLFSAAMLKNHMMITHTPGKLYQCDLCDYAAQNSNTLVLHRRKHTGEKPFKCTYENCNATFARKDALRRHERTHSRLKDNIPLNFTCDKCSCSFSKLHSLTLHKKIHSKEESHVCKVCSLSFSSKFLLVEHQVVHKLYKCDACPATYGRKAHLINHRRTHTNEKPYRCSICFEAFARSDVLKRHRANVHPQTVGYALGAISGKSRQSSEKPTSVHEENSQAVQISATFQQVPSQGSQILGTPTSKIDTEDSGHAICPGSESRLLDHDVNATVEEIDTDEVQDTSNDGGDHSEVFRTHPELENHIDGDFSIEFIVVDKSDVIEDEDEDALSDDSSNSYVLIGGGGVNDSSDDDRDDHDAVNSSDQHENTKPYSENPYDRYICDTCGLRCVSMSQLRNHRLTHTGEKPFVCEHCSKAFNRKFALKRHITLRHEKPKLSAEVAKHLNLLEVISGNSVEKSESPGEGAVLVQCEDSSEVIHDEAELKAHLLTPGKRFQCSLCGGSFARAYALEKHEQTIHGATKQRSTRSGHKSNQEEEEETQEVEMCNDVKTHKCSDCGETFEHVQSLIVHQRHHADNPLKCLTCGRSFVNKQYLALHRRTHTGEKPYACDQCDACFSRKDVLRKHKRNKHAGGPPICSLCHLSFRGISGLEKHLRIDHNGAKLKLT